LASRRALASAEPVHEEDGFLREPWWDDTRDDIVAGATSRDASVVKSDDTEAFTESSFANDFEREMETLERRHVASILTEQREGIVGRRS
jgi:hypothetical protein